MQCNNPTGEAPVILNRETKEHQLFDDNEHGDLQVLGLCTYTGDVKQPVKLRDLLDVYKGLLPNLDKNKAKKLKSK